jgi:hypothetical protein
VLIYEGRYWSAKIDDISWRGRKRKEGGIEGNGMGIG